MITLWGVGIVLVAATVAGVMRPADAPNQKVDPSYSPPAAAKVAATPAPVKPSAEDLERRLVRVKERCKIAYNDTIEVNALLEGGYSVPHQSVLNLIDRATKFEPSDGPDGDVLRVCWQTTVQRSPGIKGIEAKEIQFRCFGRDKPQAEVSPNSWRSCHVSN